MRIRVVELAESQLLCCSKSCCSSTIDPTTTCFLLLFFFTYLFIDCFKNNIKTKAAAPTLIRPQLGFITFFFNSIQFNSIYCQNIQIRSTKHCLFYQMNYDELNLCLSCPLPSKEKECKKKKTSLNRLKPSSPSIGLDWIVTCCCSCPQLQLEYYLLISD